MLDALPLTQIKHDPPVGAELFGLICVKRDRNEWDDSYSGRLKDPIQMSTQRRAPISNASPAYPIETLGDALGEGLSTGHPRMPEFRLAPGQVGDFINFL